MIPIMISLFFIKCLMVYMGGHYAMLIITIVKEFWIGKLT